MRLLRISSLKVENFDSDPPPYAIASHRWMKEEVTLQEIGARAGTLYKKQGYLKILKFCEAIKDLCKKLCPQLDLAYLWIDTCCIDKTNSVELQEALNSMFRWYAEAEVCLAYLHDVVSLDNSPSEVKRSFKESGWFTRGWTLQELIAPRRMLFYNKDWELLGTKPTVSRTPWMTARVAGVQLLNDLLTEITGVPEKVLSDFGNHIEDYSVERRRSWMKGRSTTRKEDKVYCQLGIFGVFMPLIYGEGDHAMFRLEEAIEQKQRRLRPQAQISRAVLPSKTEETKEPQRTERPASRTVGYSREAKIRDFKVYCNSTTGGLLDEVQISITDNETVGDLINDILRELRRRKSISPTLLGSGWQLGTSSFGGILKPTQEIVGVWRSELFLLPERVRA